METTTVTRPANSVSGRPAPLRVFIVEDSPEVRERLDFMVAIEGAAVCGHAARADDAIREILDTRPEVVILDIHLSEGSGFDVLRAVRKQAPDIDIYLFSNFAADAYRNLASKLGARALFDKAREAGHLREAIAQRVAKES